MDIRTWQEADRPDLPEDGFGDEFEPGYAHAPRPYVAPAYPAQAYGARPQGPAYSVRPPGPAFGALSSAAPGPRPSDSGTPNPGAQRPDRPFGAPQPDTAYTAPDVIDLGPRERSGPTSHGGRGNYSARHRSRSPFSPLRPAPIAIGSLSTAAIAAFAFVGPGILHGRAASSGTPVLDGLPNRIAPLTPGSHGSSAPANGTLGVADPSSATSTSAPGAPSATATSTGSATPGAPATSAPAGSSTGSATSAPGTTSGPGNGSPTSPGHTVTPQPPTSDPSRPTQPPTVPPSPPGSPGSPTSPPTSPVPPPTTSPSQPSPPPSSPTSTPVFDSAAAVNSALAEISDARAAQGDKALTVDPALVRAASKHTKDMVRTGKFSHTGSDGSDPFMRAQAAGCWSWSKELIARGRPGDDVVGALLRNSDSRNALLSFMNSSIGISAQQDPKTGDVYWTIELSFL